jgi:dihydroxy-acid dehydratase
VGGTIALVERLDHHRQQRQLIQLNVDDTVLAARRAQWKAPAPKYTRGVLAKYARAVSTASKGAVTDGD